MALLEFYGQECGPCIMMAPLVEKLKEEHSVNVEKYEVWHNEENLKKMREYSPGRCMGVPFLFNTETEDFICGAVDYGRLKEWAGIK